MKSTNTRDGETNPVPGAIDAVGVGYSCLDFLATVPGVPDPDTKTEIKALHVQGGGPTATAMVALARLGMRTALIAKMGDDVPGRVALSELERERVDTSRVVIEEGASSQCAFILVDERTAARTVLWTRGSVSNLNPHEVDRGLILSARCLLIDDLEIEAQEAAAAWARQGGVAVVMDAGTARAGVERLVPLATHLVASQDFPSEYTGRSDPAQAAAALLEEGPEVVVITMGADGCIALDRAGRAYEQRGFTVNAVDTTGAGDVFHGAYARGLLEGWSLERILEFSCAVAALKCTKPGGRSGIPTMAETIAFLGW